MQLIDDVKLKNRPKTYSDDDCLPQAHLVTSGSHCAVRLGHSRACVMTRSYRKGVFFFQILYSSLITLSSTASSNAATKSQI